MVIKTLALDFPLAPAAADRFAIAMTARKSPYLVRVLTAGVAAGQPWYAMEFADGEPRAAVIARGERFMPAQVAIALRERWHPNLTPAGAMGKREPSPAAPLALTAYAMLTGRHYWHADNDPEATTMQLLTEAMRGVGTPPSERAPLALPSGFDAWFTTCVTGTNADPAATFPAG